MRENIKPSRGWIVLCPIPKSEYEKGTVLLPENLKEEWGLPRSRVIAIGPQKYTAMGTPIEYNCRVGDVVMHRTGASYLFGRPIPGEAFMLIQDDQVVAVVEKTTEES